MGLIEAFVNNRVKVSVGVLLVALFGSIALTTMPTQLTPEVQIPTITVETRWPGGSPQEVEREIILEQEEQLKGVEGVSKLSSEAMDSRARITLEFSIGTDMSRALLLVNSRLQQVREYPEEADEPVVSTSNLADRPIARYILGQKTPDRAEFESFVARHPELGEVVAKLQRSLNPGVMMLRLREAAKSHPELAELIPTPMDVPKKRLFAEDFIEARLERVDGVSDAEVMGGETEEMQIVVDPQRLAVRQLTIGDVRTALQGQNRDTSGGDFWEGKRRYVVRTLGQFRSPEEVANTIIAERDGTAVYVRDVATVQLGYKKPEGVVRRYGTSTISLSVQRDTGANVLEVMKGLRAAVDELNEAVLPQQGLQLTQVYDETDYIYSSINLVKSNIVVGGALTIAILLIFLRSGRSTMIIALAIPTSIIGTFLILSLLGRSLNVISLAGLAFAVGMLVDNAVVVLENIYQHYERGDGVVEAAVRGATEVWGAVVASTLTTLAVFLPVLFVEEEAGQLFRDIALAISAAVGLSLIVSITVIPTAAAAILKQNRRSAAWRPRTRLGRSIASLGRFSKQVLLAPFDVLGRYFVDRVVGLNALLQRSILLRVVTVAALVVSSVGLSYLLMPKVEYLPSGNRNLVFGIMLPPPGYNLEQLKEIGEFIEGELRPYWDVDPGTPEAAALDAPIISDFFYVARGRQLFMGVRSHDPLRAGEMIPVLRKLGAKVPGTILVAKQSSLFESGLTAGRTVEVEIVGPSLESTVDDATGERHPGLVEMGALVLAGGALPDGTVLPGVAELIPNAQARPVPSLDLSSPEVHVRLKPEQAKELGIDAVDLGYIVDALVDGAYSGDYYFGGDKIDLTIIGQGEFASRTQDLDSLFIATPTGNLVQLSAAATVQLASGPEQVNHRERQRAITVEITPPPEVALEDAMARINDQIIAPLRESGALAGTYQINLSGTADKLQDTWQALRFNVVLALLITYLLMAALFESWLYPFVIILSVPLGAAGGFLGLWGLNQFVLQPLDVLTMLGFVILIGTVVNNPILIVHQALIHMRDEGMPMAQAILESVRSRIRPIFMTTTTTVLGLLPLVLFPGAGSELYRGLGSVMIGGLVVSTVFTLVLVPTLFSLMLQARHKVIGLLGGIDQEAPDDFDSQIGSWSDSEPEVRPVTSQPPVPVG